ncbi:MAG: nucleoside hydrolase, partial [Phenylobacterium sp.]
VRVGYLPGSSSRPEYHGLADPEAARSVFAAPLEKTITPVDTCGSVVLRAEAYARFDAHARARPGSLAAAVLETYRLWLPAVGRNPERWRDRSTVLFDTIAVYLAFSEAGLAMETLPLAIRDDGLTAIDPAGDAVRVAAAWTDYPAFEALLVDRLCG